MMMLKSLLLKTISRYKMQVRRFAQGVSAKPAYEIGKTVFQSLTGRDLLSFNGYTRNDIFSLLWIATELKRLQKSHSIGKRISLIWSNPVTKASISDACMRLNSSLCCIHEEQLKDSLTNLEMLGKALGSTADVIFLDTPSWKQDNVEEFATGCTCPVLTIGSQNFAPVLVYSELLTLFEKYDYLRRLIVSYIGPGNSPMLNTYLTVFPTVGIHFRFLAGGSVENQDSLEMGYKLASRFNTEMKEFDNLDDALYRAHIISTCFNNPSQTVLIRDTKEMDLEWSLLQHDAFKGLGVSTDFLKTKNHNLIYETIKNQSWLAQALVLGHACDYTPKLKPPRFEGVD